jgi:hypothetical protein
VKRELCDVDDDDRIQCTAELYTQLLPGRGTEEGWARFVKFALPHVRAGFEQAQDELGNPCVMTTRGWAGSNYV